jgi:hypothetical protein
MSQEGTLNPNGGGGGGIIQTINGDSGSITGAVVTIYADNAANNSGASVAFINSGTISTLNLTDVNGNTFIGKTSGNLSVANGPNTSLGAGCLSAITGGQFNFAAGINCATLLDASNNNLALGNNALSALAGSGGDSNIAIGDGCMNSLVVGARNTSMGLGAASAYSTNESDNICIGAFGVALDNNTIRIGEQGSGSSQQDRCFVAGIVGVTVSNEQNVVVDPATGQLGVSSGPVLTNYTNVTFADSPYTVLVTDQYISCDTSGGAITLNFPNAPTAFREWVVKDRTGNSATNNVTITTAGGTVTFDGSTTLLLNTAYAAFNLIANSTPTYEVY